MKIILLGVVFFLCLLLLLFLDLPQTVRIRSYALAIIPISEVKKARLIEGMCKQSYGRNWLDCYEVNAFDSWRQSIVDEYKNKKNIYMFCSIVEDIVNNSKNSEEWSVVGNNGVYHIAGNGLMMSYNVENKEIIIIGHNDIKKVKCN